VVKILQSKDSSKWNVTNRWIFRELPALALPHMILLKTSYLPNKIYKMTPTFRETFLFKHMYKDDMQLIVNSYALRSSVAEPHNFYAAPAPGKNFDAAPAPAAPAPTLLYSKTKF
jgi:hypothetical protein